MKIREILNEEKINAKEEVVFALKGDFLDEIFTEEELDIEMSNYHLVKVPDGFMIIENCNLEGLHKKEELYIDSEGRVYDIGSYPQQYYGVRAEAYVNVMLHNIYDERIYKLKEGEDPCNWWEAFLERESD